MALGGSHPPKMVCADPLLLLKQAQTKKRPWFAGASYFSSPSIIPADLRRNLDVYKECRIRATKSKIG